MIIKEATYHPILGNSVTIEQTGLEMERNLKQQFKIIEKLKGNTWKLM